MRNKQASLSEPPRAKLPVPASRFRRSRCSLPLLTLTCLFLLNFTSRAAIPAAEKLLPDDTLVLVTAPDFSRLRDLAKKMPQAQCWNDPAMKPFKDKFLLKWNEELVKPLERELDVKLGDYTSLLQGQITFAVTQNGWQGQDGEMPGLLLLLDSRDKSAQLKKNLADLRKKWVDAARPLRTEKIRDVEFTILPLSTNDVPQTLRKFLPKRGEVQELGNDKETPKPQSKDELVLGQFESLLLVGNSTKALEKVVVRLTGGAVPALGETAAYQANHLAMFRDAPCYGWVNAKVLLDLIVRQAAEKKENPDAPNPFDLKPDKIISALGLSALKTFACSFQASNEGLVVQLFLGVPEASRQGIFKILAGEPKESNPPRFVPADATKFQRWRLDGQKAWAILEKTIGDISPQWLSGINFLLDTANTAARDKDPAFDIRKNLIGNLGDDMISYEKPPRGASPAELRSPPSIFLLGSPQPEQLAAALKSVLVYLSQQAGTPPQEREFLGRRIYSVPLRPMGPPTSGAATPVSFNYAAGGGYVAMSTDASMIEEYLRSSQSDAKALRDAAGLTEAAQKVTGPGTSMFGYQNEAETLRGFFEALRKEPGSTTNSSTASGLGMLQAGLGFSAATQGFKDWLDFSLLPPFDKVSKYFYFSVYGGSANAEGLMLKAFDPVPPALKGMDASKK
ncbi:MAG TPA: hypothetical protein VNZ64_17280 [Candidatus Acidoferrum sp.]|nr:hypothetical protein [Candidatus Acidoferrum sp.]